MDRRQLEGMTKPQIIAYGTAKFGKSKSLSMRNSKGALVKSVLYLAGESAKQKAATKKAAKKKAVTKKAVTRKAPKRAAASINQVVTALGPEQVTVTVTASPSSVIHLAVNGRYFRLPLGKSVAIPAWAVPALDAVAGVTFDARASTNEEQQQ